MPPRDLWERRFTISRQLRASKDTGRSSGRAAGELKTTLHELEAFCYSLSHDMRAPLRAIQSYGQMVLDDASAQLSAEHGD